MANESQTFPLLKLPTPTQSQRPPGFGRDQVIRKPSKDRQAEKFGPQFNRLKGVLTNDAQVMSLRSDPASIAPERAIVFEIGGSLKDFYKAIEKVTGLEYLAEEEITFDANDDFVALDKKKGKEPVERPDKKVVGRVYLAMPDVAALRELVRLWELWDAGKPLGHGFANWKHLFSQLKNVRAWGPQDRILSETIDYWREELSTTHQEIRTEIELWFHRDSAARDKAYLRFQQVLKSANGKVIDHAVIEEIGYEGVLVDISRNQIETLLYGTHTALALADDIMFIRPQTVCHQPIEIEALDESASKEISQKADLPPIAALLDGLPLQRHNLLDGMLIVDDPDDLEARSPVKGRVHGTAMASLILHGDLNQSHSPLNHLLYVRPLLCSIEERERSPEDRLLVDLVYVAIKRMKESDGSAPPIAPDVYIVNLSMGDLRRPFAGVMSPWGRLLDFLSSKYGLLFIVSAGNICEEFSVPGLKTWSELEALSPDQREKQLLEAMRAQCIHRSLLSPAESLNALTIGASHEDNVAERAARGQMVMDPFTDSSLPSVISALGLGHRRAVKPDVFFPGGRFPITFKSSTGGELTVRPLTTTGRHFGLRCACPDTSGKARLNNTGLMAGTSVAAALATRGACLLHQRIFEDLGLLPNDLDPASKAVIVKALLAHSARWGERGPFLEELYGPQGQGKHNERRENVARFLGFGRVSIENALECSSNRATLIGFGSTTADSADARGYRIPLPPSLSGTVHPRWLALTLAWFSPINVRHQSYRCAKLEACADEAVNLEETLGVTRFPFQPNDAAVGKGTLFHEIYSGEKAAAFVDGSNLALRVWCREAAGALDQEIRYGFAVTLECESKIPIYTEIRDRLRVPVGLQAE